MGSHPISAFQYWQDMAGYSDQVSSAWVVDTSGCTMIKLIHKLEATRDKLKIWCKGGANDVPHQIMEINAKIKHVQSRSESGHLEAIDKECNLKHDLSTLLWLEQCQWHQKSRIKWMRDGDLNTKFFQGIANGRRRRNKIETISHVGQLLTNMPKIFTGCTDFFAGLTVLPEENVELLKPVTAAEIQWAVMEADRDSTPGPDGFGNSFFQSN
ncbi:uncharacterized protein LOC116266973 [Nymphaea colorata]|uniref:uncharacterized protein LOC116266973 n=1 Tax=Nymphaea colorata TaxID=210225 RepID=UPI00129E0AF8|nr:uncharacterized protein LOC116266973 [Nymphaea colorata]